MAIFETYITKALSQFAAIQPTTVDNVYQQLLSELSSNKAPGAHKMSCKMIKIATPAIAASLTYIFHQAIITVSSFPDESKIAIIVIPLHKSGHRNITGNYRPVSILPAITKTMERISCNQVYNYLTEFDYYK